MNKTILRSAYLLVCVLTLVSCGLGEKKTAIEINYSKEQNGILVFDQKDTIKLVGDSTIVFKTTSGAHTFVLNKEKSQKFNIPEKGGLLNLSKKRYVRFSEEYEGENKSELEMMVAAKMKKQFNNEIVVIDSLVYVYKKDSTMVVTDEQIKSALESYEDNKFSSNTMKFYESDIFIAKDWDYGLIDELPERIEIKSTNSYGNFGVTIKTKLIEENLFLLMAMFTPEYFVIKSKEEIMSNSGDKKVDEEKKKNQLEFE
ncbi:hypothetical protein [Flavobacterium sp.]|uniref:hypothetical protein n=1 Tax=Flavobacterium sp. TaxID=239 RepID=UPI004048D402